MTVRPQNARQRLLDSVILRNRFADLHGPGIIGYYVPLAGQRLCWLNLLQLKSSPVSDVPAGLANHCAWWTQEGMHMLLADALLAGTSV